MLFTNKKLEKFMKAMFVSLVTLAFLTLLHHPVYASGNVSTAIESTWKDAYGQIKTICDNVVFPAISLVLAVLFFVKLATNYFDYKKHGSFEFTAPALLFVGLILALTAKTYIWTIIGL